MATVIYRMSGSPKLSVGATSFNDVEAGSWYYDAVLWCQSKGIVNGITASRFDPEGNVTREMAACMMQRYVSYLGIDTTPKNFSAAGAYADFNDISPFALESMVWCVENGLLKGSGNRLTPKSEADRIQIATVICNLDGYLADVK